LRAGKTRNKWSPTEEVAFVSVGATVWSSFTNSDETNFVTLLPARIGINRRAGRPTEVELPSSGGRQTDEAAADSLTPAVVHLGMT
jgi:hypothetical protein